MRFFTLICGLLVLTDLPESESTTCGNAILDCMSLAFDTNVTGSCEIISERVNCFSATRDNNCSYDESMVTFNNLLPVFSDVCYEMVNYSSTCLQFTLCMLETDYSDLMNDVNYTAGPSPTHILDLTSTRFWCGYAHQTIDCFLKNNNTCALPENVQAATRAKRFWLAETCNQQAHAVSMLCQNSVDMCMTDDSGDIRNCSLQLTELTCLSRTRSQCNVNETMVAIDVLLPVLTDVCSAVNPYVMSCISLSECLASTEYARMPGIRSPEGPSIVVYNQLLNSQFWCRYLEQAVNCFLAKASVCGVPTQQIKAMDPTVDFLRSTCARDRWNYNGASVTVTASSLVLGFLTTAIALTASDTQ